MDFTDLLLKAFVALVDATCTLKYINDFLKNIPLAKVVYPTKFNYDANALKILALDNNFKNIFGNSSSFLTNFKKFSPIYSK